MPFNVKKFEIPGVMLIEPKMLGDARGYFAEIYKSTEFASIGIEDEFLQINRSKSRKNVLRGLHYQLNPMAQGKLIRVFSGEIYDVAVDIRKGSPYYGKWVGVRLTSAGLKMFYVPEGFAHGFCVMTEFAEIEYLCTNTYSQEHERGVKYNDPFFSIKWPVENPLLSEKDSKYPHLKDAENNYEY